MINKKGEVAVAEASINAKFLAVSSPSRLTFPCMDSGGESDGDSDIDSDSGNGSNSDSDSDRDSGRDNYCASDDRRKSDRDVDSGRDSDNDSDTFNDSDNYGDNDSECSTGSGCVSVDARRNHADSIQTFVRSNFPRHYHCRCVTTYYYVFIK